MLPLLKCENDCESHPPLKNVYGYCYFMLLHAQDHDTVLKVMSFTMHSHVLYVFDS